MRITNGMLTSRALSDLQGNYAAMAKAQEQVSSAKRLNRPSDNPADVQAAIKLNDSLASMAQYQRNIQAGQRSTSTAETALASAGEAVQRLKELGIQAANATMTSSDRAAIAAEVKQLSDELVSLANAKVGNDYVFSGQKTNTPAYANPTATYAGDQGAINARVSPGSTLQVNVTADVAFGPALAAAAQLATDLGSGQAPSSGTLSSLDGGLDSLLNARTQIGAIDKRLTDASSFITDTQQTAAAMLSSLVDADMASVISEASTRQMTYQAAISVNAKILQKSLINEL
jgi:flagellar hook-associated protein 3 FlgL